MITVTAVLLGSSPSHALSLAQSIKSVYGGQLTTLVDNVRVYCSMRCEEPDSDEIDEKDVMITRILRLLAAHIQSLKTATQTKISHWEKCGPVMEQMSY